MKCVILFLVMMNVCKLACTAQDFDSFVKMFPAVELPIDSVQYIGTRDTIDVRFFNLIVWENQPTQVVDGKERRIRPKVVKDGKVHEATSFGKAKESPTKYETVDGISGEFYTKVFPVARVRLHDHYVSLIVKTFGYEMSYYDLYNFTPNGERLSAIPLCMYYNAEFRSDKIGYVVMGASILQDGMIYTIEVNRGIRVERKYKLRNDGYFEIVEQEVSGKFEY